MMKIVHLIFAILASWRIVELFLADRITAKLREKFPSYIWQCSRCLSVWAGAAATIMFITCPWLNWPFALSWIYFVHNDWIVSKRSADQGRQFIVNVKSNGQWVLSRNELSQPELNDILPKLITPKPAS